MTNKIIISERFRDYIEGLSFEKTARANLITFMLDNNMDNKEMFEKINTEYLEYYIQFELAKKQLEEIYLASAYKTIPNWSLDYHSKEVTIYE
jgi:hypothetical protein